MVDMPSNLLNAIDNLSKCKNFDLRENVEVGANRVSDQGTQLEKFVRASFCGVPDTGMPTERQRRFGYGEMTSSQVFCFEGAVNNPPDAMLRNRGDAIEIKKIANRSSAIHLNSSRPKHTLNADDPTLASDARPPPHGECEQWESRDLLYAIGWLPKSPRTLRYLFFVYGDCMFKQNEFYEGRFDEIKRAVGNVDGINQDGNEYGVLEDVDGLGIKLNMRVRSMNGCANPLKIFEDIIDYDHKKSKFSLFAVMRSSKFESFPDHAQHLLTDNQEITHTTKQIRDPDNPGGEIRVEVFSFTKT